MQQNSPSTRKSVFQMKHEKAGELACLLSFLFYFLCSGLRSIYFFHARMFVIDSAEGCNELLLLLKLYLMRLEASLKTKVMPKFGMKWNLQ